MKDSEAENHLGYMRKPANQRKQNSKKENTRYEQSICKNQRKQNSKKENTRYEQSICKNLICNQYLHNIQLR